MMLLTVIGLHGTGGLWHPFDPVSHKHEAHTSNFYRRAVMLLRSRV